MASLKENLTTQVCTSFTDRDIDRLNDAAKRLNVSRAELIRVCVLNDLPKLLDRETKRTLRRRA